MYTILKWEILPGEFIYISVANAYHAFWCSSLCSVTCLKIWRCAINTYTTEYYWIFMKITMIVSFLCRARWGADMEMPCYLPKLLFELNEQRKRDFFCDCSILVEGRVFKAHRNVLFAGSGYFRALLVHYLQVKICCMYIRFCRKSPVFPCIVSKSVLLEIQRRTSMQHASMCCEWENAA